MSACGGGCGEGLRWPESGDWVPRQALHMGGVAAGGALVLPGLAPEVALAGRQVRTNFGGLRQGGCVTHFVSMTSHDRSYVNPASGDF